MSINVAGKNWLVSKWKSYIFRHVFQNARAAKPQAPLHEGLESPERSLVLRGVVGKELDPRERVGCLILERLWQERWIGLADKFLGMAPAALKASVYKT